MAGKRKTSKRLIFVVVPRKIWIIRKGKKELVKVLKTVKQLVNKNNIN